MLGGRTFFEHADREPSNSTEISKSMAVGTNGLYFNCLHKCQAVEVVLIIFL